MATIKTIDELNTMSKEAVREYEYRELGFIAPMFDAVTHVDNIRKSVAPETVMRVWRCSWTFDNQRQREYARMIFKARGYRVYDAQCCDPKLPHYPQLVTYL